MDDHDLNNARLAGEKIYQYDYLPRGTYPRLQPRAAQPEIQTLTAGSSVVVSDAWARLNPQAYRRVGHAVAGARRDFEGLSMLR